MEGNFGTVRIWRMTMNLPNFPHPNILAGEENSKPSLGLINFLLDQGLLG